MELSQDIDRHLTDQRELRREVEILGSTLTRTSGLALGLSHLVGIILVLCGNTQWTACSCPMLVPQWHPRTQGC